MSPAAIFIGAIIAVIALASIAIATSLFIGRADPRLTALQSDPMAKVQLEHTTLLRQHMRKTDTALGMPVHANVTRMFTYSGLTQRELLNRASAEANRVGWTQEFRRASSYTGSKRIDGVPAHLTITTDYRSPGTIFVISLTADDAE